MRLDKYKTAIVCILVLLRGAALVANPIEEAFPPLLDVAVARGLDDLARQQQADGSFTAFDEPGPRMLPAAQALLAFLSAGQVPAVGRHALVVRNAVDFIVRQLPEDGEFGRADASGPFGQAMITIALAEVYGLQTDAIQRLPIRDALDKALKAILKSQDVRNDPMSGGWAIEGNGEGDLVATLWMVLSLHSLRDAGLDVPREPMGRAAAFARACRKRDPRGFSNRGAGPTPVSNAAGMAILRLAERGGVEGLKPPATLPAERSPEEAADLYGSIYAITLAAMLTDDPGWMARWKSTRDLLLPKQMEDGSWFPTRAPQFGLGTVGATSTAVMTLAMPYRLLPLYGR